MYAILVSIALAIYTLILIDFSLLFQEISVNADMMNSTQALYTAEGVVENTLGIVGDRDTAMRNIYFLNEKEITVNNTSEAYLPYHEESDSFYIQRNMRLDESDLNAAEAFDANNRIVRSEAYLADGQTLNRQSYYGLEPLKSRAFAVREVDVENNFNEIAFDYNQNDENSELDFEVFVFPREGASLDFLDFDSLKNGFESSVKRIVINTGDSSQNGRSFPVTGQPLVVQFGSSPDHYKDRVSISGFQPLNNNYILYFQTLDNQPVHFKLSAFYQNQPVMLPNMMQTIDVIGATPTGLYQRVKYQRQTEEGIIPGMNFVHFSNGPIHK